MREGYQPLDTIRASYGLQGQRLQYGKIRSEGALPKNLFEQNRNTVSHTAWACVVYSMVPYLGIVFVPFAFVIGGYAYLVSYRHPQSGGRKLAVRSIAVTVIILAVQIALWWIFYVAPAIGRRASGY